MIFDWNSSSEYENGHQRSNVTPPNRGFLAFDWNSSDKFENGHRRSHVTPINRGLLPPPLPQKLIYLQFQPIQTKFSHMTFDWNNSSEFKNGHHRSNVGGFCPPENSNTSDFNEI